MTKRLFVDLPDKSTPRNAKNLNALNNLAIDTTTTGHDEEVVVIKSNLFDKTTISSGKGIYVANGDLYDDSNLFTTDYISITGYGRIYFNKNVGTNNWCAFYDSSKTFISGVFSTSYSFDVPGNASYIRINFNLTDLDNVVISSVLSEIDALIGSTYSKLTDTLNIGVDSNNAGLWVEASKNLLSVNSATGVENLFSNISIDLPVGTYTISYKASITTGAVQFNFNNGSTIVTSVTLQNTSSEEGVSFTLTSSVNNCTMYASNEGTYTNIQIEPGPNKTTYEPYVNPSIKVNINGEYNELLSQETLSYANDLFNNLKIYTYDIWDGTWSEEYTKTTGINLNGSYGGISIIAWETSHFSSGNATATRLTLIRGGYSGNNMSQVEIAKNYGDGDVGLTYGIDSNGYLTCTKKYNGEALVKFFTICSKASD